MRVHDIDPYDMAARLLRSSHYRDGDCGGYSVWMRAGPGRPDTPDARHACKAWLKSLPPEEFHHRLAQTVEHALRELQGCMEIPGALRLTRVIAAPDTFIDEVRAGKQDFGSCWSVNWSGDGNKPRVGGYSRPCAPGLSEYYITADVTEDGIDWQTTLELVIGWGDYEKEVRLLPGAPAQVVSIEDHDGNDLLQVPSPSSRAA